MVITDELKKVLDSVNRFIDAFPHDRNGHIKIIMQAGVVHRILGHTELARGEKGKVLNRDNLNKTILESIKRIKYGDVKVMMMYGEVVDVQEEITYELWNAKKQENPKNQMGGGAAKKQHLK